jgi:Tfp pilus assembly protein PilX
MTQMARQAVYSQNGIALVTVMLVMVIMTVIGIAAITVTGLENRMAGFQRTGEAAATAAESCVSTSVNIIQQVIDLGGVPDEFLSTQPTNPGPVPSIAQQTLLKNEIMGQSDNNSDDPNVAPNIILSLGAFTVNGDIDRLYAKPKTGAAMQFASGYEGMAGGAAGGGVDIMYRITCATTNLNTGTTSQISAVYACTATGESCQRKI